MYRYSAGRVFLGTFDSGQPSIMQLWGDVDGSYYTANWDAQTITKRAGLGSTLIWSTNIGVRASGVTADENYVYAMGETGATVWQLARSDGHVVRTFQLGGGDTTTTMFGGLVDALGTLYVPRFNVTHNSPLVYRYDLGSGLAYSEFNPLANVTTGAFDGVRYRVSHGDTNVYCHTLVQVSCPRVVTAATATTRTWPRSSAIAEMGDGVDQNCNGQIDEGCDKDQDGYCDAKPRSSSGRPPCALAAVATATIPTPPCIRAPPRPATAPTTTATVASTKSATRTRTATATRASRW